MRKPIGIFFLALYLLAMLRPVLPWVEYYANKGYIQKFLCINQDKPKMACAGKCHLQKRITEANDTNDKKVPTRVNLEDYPLSLLDSGNWQINTLAKAPCLLNGSYHNQYKLLLINAPFHPPQV